MRKLFCLTLVFVLVFGIAGCANAPSKERVKTYIQKQTTTGVFQDDIMVTSDIPYASSHLTTFDVYYKEEYTDAPIIVVTHGGADVSDGNPQKDRLRAENGGNDKTGMSGVVPVYTDLGFVVVTPNYRWSSAEFSKVHDVACSIATFREIAHEFGADADTIVLQGNSGGSYISTFLYFKQEHDWLEGCLVKKSLPSFKGLISKSSFNLGVAIEEGINVEYLPGGVLYKATDEIKESTAFVDHLAKEVNGGQGLEVEDTLRDGAINHIDPTDGSVFVIYGDKDPKWETSQIQWEYISLLEENSIPHTVFVQAGGGHGVKIEQRPKLKERVQAYVVAVAHDEELPEFFE